MADPEKGGIHQQQNSKADNGNNTDHYRHSFSKYCSLLTF